MHSNYSEKIVSRLAAKEVISFWQQLGFEVVFTNGCFDILHYGHLSYLAEAAELGDMLIIAANSASSIKGLKGDNRPIQDTNTRLHQLAALEFVDLVVEFDEETPLNIINELRPDIIVKGGDYQPDDIVGAKQVRSWGGEVKILPFVEGYSTTSIEQKIKDAH